MNIPQSLQIALRVFAIMCIGAQQKYICVYFQILVLNNLNMQVTHWNQFYDGQDYIQTS